MLTAKIALFIFYFFTPALILWAATKFPFINKIGAIIIAYVIGLVVGTAGLLPPWAGEVQNVVNMLTIPLAIPLLLFSCNFKSWLQLAAKTMLALVIAVFSVVVVVIGGYFLFNHGNVHELWKTAGLLIAVYVGATANMAAVKLMLNIDPSVYIVVQTYDILMSSVYLLFLMTIAHRLFLKILPAFKHTQKQQAEQEVEAQFENYQGIFTRARFKPMLIAVGLSILIAVVGLLLSLLAAEKSQMLVIILTITTLGILVSLIPKVNKIEKTFEAGMYLILVFSINVASMANIHALVNISLPIFLYITLAIFGSLILQVIISAIFKIDADTVLITSNALINSAPFVPMVAASYKNREIIVSGITVGIIGFTIGNYCAWLVAELLHHF